MSGLERLSRFARGESPAPPLSHLTGRTRDRGRRRDRERLDASSEWLLNSAGVIGGGVLAIVADIAFGLLDRDTAARRHALYDGGAVAHVPEPGPPSRDA